MKTKIKSCLFGGKIIRDGFLHFRKKLILIKLVIFFIS